MLGRCADVDQLVSDGGFLAAAFASAVVMAFVVLLVRGAGGSLGAGRARGIVVGWQVEHFLAGCSAVCCCWPSPEPSGRAAIPALRAVLTVPGALVLAQDIPAEAPSWIRVVSSSRSPWSRCSFSRPPAPRRGSRRLLLLGTSLGVYVCVPDTEASPRSSVRCCRAPWSRCSSGAGRASAHGAHGSSARSVGGGRRRGVAPGSVVGRYRVPRRARGRTHRVLAQPACRRGGPAAASTPAWCCSSPGSPASGSRRGRRRVLCVHGVLAVHVVRSRRRSGSGRWSPPYGTSIRGHACGG